MSQPSLLLALLVLALGVVSIVVAPLTYGVPVTTDTFGRTYSSQSGIYTATPGQISLVSGNASGTLDSLTLDTKATNGLLVNSFYWDGTFAGLVGFQLATATLPDGP